MGLLGAFCLAMGPIGVFGIGGVSFTGGFYQQQGKEARTQPESCARRFSIRATVNIKVALDIGFYRDSIMGPTKILIYDAHLFGSPVILNGAYYMSPCNNPLSQGSR